MSLLPASTSKLLDDRLRLFVVALAELMMPDLALRIDEIQRRPVLFVNASQIA